MDGARENQPRTPRRNDDALPEPSLSPSQDRTESSSPSQEYECTTAALTSAPSERYPILMSYQASEVAVLNSSHSQYERWYHLRHPPQSSPSSSRTVPSRTVVRPCDEAPNPASCQTILPSLNVASQFNEDYFQYPLYLNAHVGNASGFQSQIYHEVRQVPRDPHLSYPCQFVEGHSLMHVNQLNHHNSSTHPQFALVCHNSGMPNSLNCWPRESELPSMISSNHINIQHGNLPRSFSSFSNCVIGPPISFGSEMVPRSTQGAIGENILPYSHAINQLEDDQNTMPMRQINDILESTNDVPDPNRISRRERTPNPNSIYRGTREMPMPIQSTHDNSICEQNHQLTHIPRADRNSAQFPRRLTRHLPSTRHSVSCSTIGQHRRSLNSESISNPQNTSRDSLYQEGESQSQHNSFEADHTNHKYRHSPSKKKSTNRHEFSEKRKRREVSPKVENESRHRLPRKVRQTTNHYENQNGSNCERSSNRNQPDVEMSSGESSSWYNTGMTDSSHRVEVDSTENNIESRQQSDCRRNRGNGENKTPSICSMSTSPNDAISETLQPRSLERLPIRYLVSRAEFQQQQDCIHETGTTNARRYGQRMCSHSCEMMRYRQPVNNNNKNTNSHIQGHHVTRETPVEDSSNSTDGEIRENDMPTSHGINQSMDEQGNGPIQETNGIDNSTINVTANSYRICRRQRRPNLNSIHRETRELPVPIQSTYDSSISEHNHQLTHTPRADRNHAQFPRRLTRRLPFTRHSVSCSTMFQHRRRLNPESTARRHMSNPRNTTGSSLYQAGSLQSQNTSFDADHTNHKYRRSPSREKSPKGHEVSQKRKRQKVSPNVESESQHRSPINVHQTTNHNENQNGSNCERSPRSNQPNEEMSSGESSSWYDTGMTDSSHRVEVDSTENNIESRQQSACRGNRANGENTNPWTCSMSTSPNDSISETIQARPLERPPNRHLRNRAEFQAYIQERETSNSPGIQRSSRGMRRYQQPMNNNIYNHLQRQNMTRESPVEVSPRSTDREIRENRMLTPQSINEFQDDDENRFIQVNNIHENPRPEDTVESQLLYQAFILDNVLNICNRRPDNEIDLRLDRHELLHMYFFTPMIQPLDYLILRCGFLDLQWQPSASVVCLIKRFHTLLDEATSSNTLYGEPSLRLFSGFFNCLHAPSYDCLDTTCSKISNALFNFSKQVSSFPNNASYEQPLAVSEHPEDNGMSNNPCSPSYNPALAQDQYHIGDDEPGFETDNQERIDAMFREFCRLHSNALRMHCGTTDNRSTPSSEQREVRSSREDTFEQHTEQDYSYLQMCQQQSEATFREFRRLNAGSSQHYMPPSGSSRSKNDSSLASIPSEPDGSRNRSGCIELSGVEDTSQDAVPPNPRGSSTCTIGTNGNGCEIFRPIAMKKRVTPKYKEAKIHIRYKASKEITATSHRCQCHRGNANFVTSYLYFKSPSGVWVRTTRSPCGSQLVSTKNKDHRRILFIREADGHIDFFIREASGHTTIVCIEEFDHVTVLQQAWPEPMRELAPQGDTRVGHSHLQYLQYVVELMNRRTHRRRRKGTRRKKI